MAAAPPLTFLLNHGGQGSHAAVWTISASASQWLLPAVVATWLLGVFAFSIRLFGGWRFAARLRSTAHPGCTAWQRTLQKVAKQVGASQSVRLLVSSLVDVPTVIGWLRPVILVPVEHLAGLPFEYIEALLAHELAHIRRRDYLASILQGVAEAVLFYHPAVWWISQQIRAERELCCDDLAVDAIGDALSYARALAKLESLHPARVAPGLAANGGSLLHRIQRLIEPSRPVTHTLPGPATASAMLLLWAAGVGVATIHAAQTPTVPSPANLSPLPVSAWSVAGLALPVRKTLLFDPLLSAQLAPGDNAADDSKWRDWLNNDVPWIITDNERKAFDGLTTDDEREQFIEQFWLRRDPTPGTIRNEFKEEHYRRIQYANQHFASSLPGWKTDRGRIYIVYGPPDEIDSHPSGGGNTHAYPFEDWLYRHVEGVGSDVSIEFVDTAMNGEYNMSTGVKTVQDALLNNAAPNWFWKIQAPPASELFSYTILPMLVHVAYLRVNESTTMANITIQFENRELQFQTGDAGRKAQVNIMGRLSTMARRPVATFEKPIETATPAQQNTEYQQSVPLAPGRYRLNIVAKDIHSGHLNNYAAALEVPRFDRDKLTSSDLILASTIERLPLKNLSENAMFAIGNREVRPRLGDRFTSEEKLGIYLEFYNFKPDDTTHKPSGSIEYEIDRAGSNENVLDFSEDIRSIADASPSQVTIAKTFPLTTFQPGIYTLTVKAFDKNGNQTAQRQKNFTVAP